MALMSEDDLRDLLATHLSVLEPKLTLLEKEAYLPHDMGTRSFVDLLAQDTARRYVLIELKRTAAASREAIHEVYKYAEAAKKHLGTREDEIRVLVVSTDWRELLVPFSRFLADTNISVRGVLLKVLDGSRLAAEPITPLPTNHGRYLAPWHDLNLYNNAEHLDLGIRDHEAYCARNGIRDFVMVILKAAPNFNEDARVQFEKVYKATLGPVGGAIDDNTVGRLSASLEKFEFILYFAMRMMTRAEGVALITDNKLRSEVEQQFELTDEEEALHHLHQTLSSIEPGPYRDYYEIGYPAKLRCKLLEDEGWTIQEVMRFGVFARNKALSDESIVDELSGSDGLSKQDLKSTINIADPSQLRVLRDQISRCLADNPRWKAQISRVLDEIKTERPDATIDISVFNPCCGLITLFLTRTRGLDYWPHYLIRIRDVTPERIYLGFLEFQPSSTRRSLRKLIEKYYDGEISSLLMSLTWGGYEARDTVILEDVGLLYRTARVDNPKPGAPAMILKDDRWYREPQQFHPFNGVMEFFERRKPLMESIVPQISSRWNGTIVDLSKASSI